MKFKTSELTGRALEVAVDLAKGFTFQRGIPDNEWAREEACRSGFWRLNPSGDRWACVTCMRWNDESADFEGLIRDEKICLDAGDGLYKDPNRMWAAWLAENAPVNVEDEITGATPREAAFRCFVASRLGDEVEIDEGLLE
jgi:hypothetical protein